MFGRHTITILSSIALIACAVSNDPRQGGLFGGLHGLSSGAYDARVQQRKAELSRHQSLQQGLKDQSKSLESQVQARDFALASEQQILAKMENDLSKLEADLNRLEANSDRQKSEIAALTGKIEDHWRRLRSQQAAVAELDRAGGSSADPGRYQILTQERDRLAEEYRRLLKYTQALSNAAR